MALPGQLNEDSDCDDDINGHHFSREETLIIFDWDDTVMPSSWVLEEGLQLEGEELPEQQKVRLSELSKLAAETLALAGQLGTVLLVTNAETGWVELSCQRFLPDLLPALRTVRTLSARTQYETPRVSSPFEWKHRAFLCEISRTFEGSLAKPRRRNILSFGDSGHEREALIKATVNMPHTRTKSIKFLDRPGVEELRKQHALMGKCLRKIVHHDGNVDLFLRLAETPQDLK
ncbi:unnamed protein product [Effrenium voratum]|nr:unnamed protein product [Effrenium voratum]|mmetsp:Transcript_136058/g.322443  ORF Transcript_136058/g.322443 Transcript_136058/m.322443 type:complete len:232 (-) Transcript_136058:47-742(-)